MIFRGRIYDEFKKVGQDGIKFSLQLSNGKERVVAPTESRTMLGGHNDTNCSRFYSNEEKNLERWRKPTFADCTAFGGIATRILNEYKPKDEIWLIAKYYSKQQDGKHYKGFIVREIVSFASFSFRKEKRKSIEMPKFFDANYGSVRTYLAEAWQAIYSVDLKELF